MTGTAVSLGTVDDLHASATRRTGLSDFGAGEYRDGLAVLIESYERDAGLTELGAKVARAGMRDTLVARLIAEASWWANPACADVRIERPIFVTGLPRTGTTALHRLLCADPQAQGLELWLTAAPQPRPPRDEWPQNPFFAAMQAGFDKHHAENPDFMGVHYMAADTVEECWQVLRQTFRSIGFESLAHLPGYSAWLQTQSWTEAYERHRRNLQVIGAHEPHKRWVLKNPSHLFAVDALLETYPDALIVVTHRDPVTALASSCSLSAQATAGQSTVFVGETIGRDQLDLWARGAELYRDARARHDEASFLDVDQRDLIADPIAVAERIYQRLGTPLSDEARAAMTSLGPEGSAGAAPAHRYTLEEFGLDADVVRRRLHM
ncbi:MAG: sulfotransferase family protein [Jatrophihabitans sp.]|uniref:sulfotransferase family protein n=1 Tax=Jatrophihabitans sp. TaxID=1932789 RepID=UPI003F81AB60